MQPEMTSATPTGLPPIGKPLAAFKRLSPTVAYYEPSNLTAPSLPDDVSPTTILFCSWMNARPKNIDYYTRTYMSLFPHARIIHVTINTTQFIFQPESQRRKDMKEAVSLLLSRDQDTERLLVHSISNGGGKRVYNIAAAYRSVTGNPLPAKTFILDSAPGMPRFKRDVHALMVPARNMHWVPWMLFATVVHVICAVIFVSVYWTPEWFWYDLVLGPTCGCNDEKLLEKKSIRGYVYSKEDMAIDWRDVEAHAAVAEGKGYEVRRKLILGAEHARLFRGKAGEEDYWGFIRGLCAKGMALR